MPGHKVTFGERITCCNKSNLEKLKGTSKVTRPVRAFQFITTSSHFWLRYVFCSFACFQELSQERNLELLGMHSAAIAEGGT